jgi:hypothetical protein
MDDAKQKQKAGGGIIYKLNKKLKTTMGFVKENMEKTVDIMKDSLGIDSSILKKVTEDCFNCLSSDEDGNSYIDLTKDDNWNANRQTFIDKCCRGDQDPIRVRYTPLPFPM